MEVRNIVRHKWIVPVAALILVLSIGAGAWAATGTTDGSTPTTNQGSTPSTQDGSGSSTDCDTRSDCLPGEKGARAWGHMRGFSDDEARQEARSEMRNKMQERLDAWVDSVREQMTAEDEVTLNSLLEQLETQRSALEKAADDVRGTMEELRDLVKQYKPDSSDGTGGSSNSTSGTSATTGPAGSSTLYQ